MEFWIDVLLFMLLWWCIGMTLPEHIIHTYKLHMLANHELKTAQAKISWFRSGGAGTDEWQLMAELIDIPGVSGKCECFMSIAQSSLFHLKAGDITEVKYITQRIFGKTIAVAMLANDIINPRWNNRVMLIVVGFLSIVYAGMSGLVLTTVPAACRIWLLLTVPFLLVGGAIAAKKWGTECTTGTVRGLDRADTTKKGKLPVE